MGTPETDTLRGTPRRDVIVALDGDDQVDGLGGNDLICGGLGHDFVLGRAGVDRLDGNTGEDFLLGGAGNDVLKTGPGVVNYLTGDAGDDRFVGGNGIDYADYLESRQPISASLTSGTATGEGTDTFKNIEGLIGSNFADDLTGNTGTNILIGSEGNDVLDAAGNEGSLDKPISEGGYDIMAGDGDPQGTPGNDTLTGRAGLNIVDYTNSGAAVTVDLQQGTATGEGTDLLSGIQVASGSVYDDTLTGDREDNGFRPFFGNDMVDGAQGADVLVFTLAEDGVITDLTSGIATGEGTDRFAGIENLWGSLGPDRLTGDDTPNRLYGRSGGDNIAGAGGNDVLNGGDGEDSLDGGDGEDSCVGGEENTNCETEGDLAALPTSWVDATVLMWLQIRAALVAGA